MPGQSGLDLLAYAHNRLPDVPFVLMIALLDERLRAAAFAGGASAALDKADVLDSVEPLPSQSALAA